MGILKLLVWGVIIFFILAIIGYYPTLTVAVTAVSIVLLFLVFGKE